MDAHERNNGTPREKPEAEGAAPAPGKKRNLGWRIVKWTLVSLLGLVALCVLLLCIATWWLTPERLTKIVNKEASEALTADVRASNVRFTLWSTWPHLCIEADSLYVRSRTLDSIAPELKKQLPAGSDFLLSTASLKGGANLLKLFGGKLWLRDIEVDSLRVNLVALTDSLSNYNIVPGKGKGHVPEFHIDGMRLRKAGSIQFTGVPSQTRASVRLADASLMPGKGRNQYALVLKGNVTAESGRLVLFEKFPFELDGDVQVRFNPFGVSTTDYRVALGGVKGRMSMDLAMGSDDSESSSLKLNDFDYKLEDVSLTDILSLFPSLKSPVLKRMQADLDLECSARLTSPYIFSSPWLPSAQVDFKVAGGELDYTLADGKRYGIDDVRLLGRLVFDGRHPERSYVEIPDLSLQGMGAKVDVNAEITHLTTEPHVDARLKASGNLQALASQVDVLKPYSPKGDVALRADLQFSVAESTIYGSVVNVEAESPEASFKVGKDAVRISDLKISTGESFAQGLNADALAREIPLDVQLKASRIRVTMPGDSVTLDMGKARAEGKISRLGSGAVLRSFDIALQGDTATVQRRGDRGMARNMKLRLQGSLMKKAQLPANYKVPAQWNADKRTLGFAAHSPQYIQVKTPKGLRDLMSQWRTRLDLQVEDARLDTKSFRAQNTLHGLDLTASFDSLLVRNADFASGRTRGRLSGRVGNLRQFLTSATPAPLLVDLSLALDTVQMNELARAYALAHPKSAMASGNKSEMDEGIDTVAYLVPRNLRGKIHFSAEQTRYINLHLYDLWGDMTLADGRAVIDTLHISSDFGHAGMKLTYNTSDLQRMEISTDLSLLDINVVNFFKNFHALLVMWPEMHNLSGMLSARLQGRLMMYPSNYLVVPSLWAKAEVKGWDLVLKQNHFIRHVTRMLMIPDSKPLHIHNMDILAAVHDNLLEVFPFTFEVRDYRLKLLGLNNFDGNLYYHVGVEKWPLKIPFGLNVKGMYHHPEIRFGGQDWHDEEGTKITAGVQDYDRMNVIKEVREYMREFVHAAASYHPGEE